MIRFTDFALAKGKPTEGTVLMHSQGRIFRLEWWIRDSTQPEVVCLAYPHSPISTWLHLEGLGWPQLHDQKLPIHASALAAFGQVTDQEIADLFQYATDEEEAESYDDEPQVRDGEDEDE